MGLHDNERSKQVSMPAGPDAHGQAALLLTESLIHGLCENATLSADQAVEIVERALDVQLERAEAADGAGAPMWRSHALLASIAASLRTDCKDARTPPRLVV
jgi:hypothetical protein